MISFHLKGLTGYTLLCCSLIPLLHWGLGSDDSGLVGWRGSKIWFWCGDCWCHMCRKRVWGDLLLTMWGSLRDRGRIPSRSEMAWRAGRGYWLWLLWWVGFGLGWALWSLSFPPEPKEAAHGFPPRLPWHASGGEEGGMGLESCQESNIKNGDSPFLWPPLGTTRFYIKSLFIWLLFPPLGYEVWFVYPPISRAENCAEPLEALSRYLLKGCWGVDGFHLLMNGCISDPRACDILFYSFSSLAPKSLIRFLFLTGSSSTLASLSE